MRGTVAGPFDSLKSRCGIAEGSGLVLCETIDGVSTPEGLNLAALTAAGLAQGS